MRENLIDILKYCFFQTPEELARLNGHIDPRPIEDLLDDILKFCVTRPPPVVTWPVPKSVNWTAEGVVVKPRNQVIQK